MKPSDIILTKVIKHCTKSGRKELNPTDSDFIVAILEYLDENSSYDDKTITDEHFK